MKIIRTDFSPGIIALLIVLAIIAIPILIVIGLCWLIFFALTGMSPSPAAFFRKRKKRRENIHEGPFRQEAPRRNAPSAANDETIECEVLSARTLDENGQEIR